MSATAARTEGDPAKKVEPTSRWARVDGLWVHYRASEEVATGVRPAVVLVHGLIVSGRYMVPTLKHLARQYRVYAPDLPGFGKSEKPRAVLDVPGLSGALSSWMDAVGLEETALVGNSMGCHLIRSYPSGAGPMALQSSTGEPG